MQLSDLKEFALLFWRGAMGIIFHVLIFLASICVLLSWGKEAAKDFWENASDE